MTSSFSNEVVVSNSGSCSGFGLTLCKDGRPGCDVDCLLEISRGGSIDESCTSLFAAEIQACSGPGTPLTQYNPCTRLGPPGGSQAWAFACCNNDGNCASCPSGGGGFEDECDDFFDGPQNCGFGGGDPLCYCETPIFISSRGNRLNLTDRTNGVDFDLNSDGVAERIPWTEPGSDDVLLVIDRNGNGRIDDGSELFGNFSPQPALASAHNGFTALSVYDHPDRGGNGDGVISSEDSGFEDLRFWRDINHDGISQRRELRFVSRTRVLSFELNYRESRRTDEHGNRFRYIGRINMDPSRPGPRKKFAVDVFFPPPVLP